MFKVACVSTLEDDYGLGTKMSGILAGPRDAAGGIRIAGQNGAKGVVMAWESLNWLWRVSDEINY